MPNEQLTSDETIDHALENGFALVLEAEDCGDWKSVARWLARNPALGGEVSQFIDDQEKLRVALKTLSAAPDRAGTTVGGVELIEVMGRGAMGIVYRARDPKLSRDVAVKMLHASGAPIPADLARFRGEAERVAALDHPNIVLVYSFGEANGTAYLVMPLMTGGTLDDYRKAQPGGRLSAEEAARLVRDVARGIHHAHQRGLIHRDLKPLNVLLDETNTPKVADFGLARQIDGTAHTEGIAGTFAYMAPEQARGDKGLTFAVDVHALGVTLFELLTGKLPFGSGPSAIQRVIADAPPPMRMVAPDISVPQDLEAICLKCLEKQPESRYATALEVAEELDRFLRGEPVKARPPGFWDWLRQLARIRPEQYPNPAWQVTAWFSLSTLVTHTAIYAMVQVDGPAIGIWFANSAAFVTLLGVLWWYMLRRFRHVPITDRHSLIIAIGTLFAYFPLMAAYVPLSLSAPASDGLGIYPAFAILSGLGIFTLGSTHWSRFFLIGLAVMALAPAMVRWPEEAPLIYGCATAAVLGYWSLVKHGLATKSTE